MNLQELKSGYDYYVVSEDENGTPCSGRARFIELDLSSGYDYCGGVGVFRWGKDDIGYHTADEIKYLIGEGRLCPFCGGSDIVEIGPWIALSDEDKNNSCRLVEFQCASCDNRSFWT